MEKPSSPCASVADDKSTLFQNPKLKPPPWEPTHMCLPVSSHPGDDATVVDLKQWFVPVENSNSFPHDDVSVVRTHLFVLCAFVLAQLEHLLFSCHVTHCFFFTISQFFNRTSDTGSHQQ
jgi:hypothetical protein